MIYIQLNNFKKLPNDWEIFQSCVNGESLVFSGV